jgi:hypothetical protein
MGMDLLQNLRSDRVRRRRKQPYGREVFNTVSCIVKGYGLGEDFLKMLDQIADYLSRQGMDWNAVRPKKVFELPPFSLVAEDEYRLVRTIAARLDNPYLPFAHSPEEMLLSAPLFEANPALGSEDLLRHDFATLLLCQRAREELANLKQQSGSLPGMVGQDVGMQQYRGERSPISVLQDRIKRLETFIASVETTGPQPE